MTAREQQHRRQIGASAAREGIETARARGLSDRVREFTALRQEQSQPLPGIHIPRMEGENAPEFFLGAAPVPVVMPLDERESGTRFGERFVDFERVQRGGSRLWHVTRGVD